MKSWCHDDVIRFRITSNRGLTCLKLISHEPHQIHYRTDLELCDMSYTDMTQCWSFSGWNRKFNRNKFYSTIIVCSQCDRECEYRIISQRPHLRNLTKVLMLFFRDHKVTPIWPLISVQTGSQSLRFKKIISQQPQEVNSLFLYHCTDR